MSLLNSLNLNCYYNSTTFHLPQYSSNYYRKCPASTSNLGPSSSCLLIINNSHQPQCPNSLFPPANQSVAAIVFGDGSSHSRLYPLTKRRSEGAIPIAGNYRLIDAVVSNCINSDITKIYALTQFNSTSLNSHLSRAYGSVQVIAAYQSPEHINGWFQGSADAIRKCLWVLEEYPSVLELLILPGHHLYRMDYQKLIDSHRRSNADVTVSVLSGTSGRNYKDGNIIEDLGFGIFKLLSAADHQYQNHEVVEFRAKGNIIINYPDNSNIDEMDNWENNYAAGMGIYVINRNAMIKLITDYFPSANDLTSEVIPGALSLGMKVHAYKFDGYWEDMRSIGAYYRANMEMINWRTNKAAAYNHSLLYDRECPLYTLPRHLPPTLIADAVITDSVIGDGCILGRCKIKGSVVGMRTRISDEAVVEDSVIIGSETYNPSQIGGSEGEGIGNKLIPVGIGEGAHIRKAIIDKNARIGRNVMIINKDKVLESNMEANGYIITDGIIVVIRSAVIPDGTIL